MVTCAAGTSPDQAAPATMSVVARLIELQVHLSRQPLPVSCVMS